MIIVWGQGPLNQQQFQVLVPGTLVLNYGVVSLGIFSDFEKVAFTDETLAAPALSTEALNAATLSTEKLI